MTVIPEKGKWTRLVQVAGESGGKAAARYGRNFSGVGDDLRGHAEKITCQENSAISIRGYNSRGVPIQKFRASLFQHYPVFSDDKCKTRYRG